MLLENKIYRLAELGEAHEAFAQNGVVIFEKLLNDSEFENAEMKVREEIGKGINTIPNIHSKNKWFSDFVQKKEFTNVAKALLGVEHVKVFTTMILNKPPMGLMTVPWHQDAAYDWPIDPVDCASLWLAFDDVTPENGAMEIAIGAHKYGSLAMASSEKLKEGDSHFSDQLEKSIGDEALSKYKKIYLTMPKGYASFHHSMIPHRSNSNTTKSGRCALVVRYCGEKTKLIKYKGMKRENDFKDIEFLDCRR